MNNAEVFDLALEEEQNNQLNKLELANRYSGWLLCIEESFKILKQDNNISAIEMITRLANMSQNKVESLCK